VGVWDKLATLRTDGKKTTIHNAPWNHSAHNQTECYCGHEVCTRRRNDTLRDTIRPENNAKKNVPVGKDTHLMVRNGEGQE
jgi:hypothetical protein